MEQSKQVSQVSQPSPNGPANQSNTTSQARAYGYGKRRDDASSEGREVLPSGQRQRSEAASTLLPPVDIYEDEAGFTVVADLPGVSKEQLAVRVSGDSLVIEGTASAPVTADMELLYEEIRSPQYRRSFTLSRELDPGKIEAKLSNGVLELHIPKAEEAKPRRICVNVT
jgi:HSP20 family protein